jgi:hypothetical protein
MKLTTSLRKDDVERPVVEGQRLCYTLAHVRTRNAVLAGGHEGLRGVDRRNVFDADEIGKRARKTTRTTPDVERTVAAHDPRSPDYRRRQLGGVASDVSVVDRRVRFEGHGRSLHASVRTVLIRPT